MAKREIHVAVIVRGGMVQEVYADSANVDVEVYDFDSDAYTEDANDEDAVEKANDEREQEVDKIEAEWKCVW